LVDSAQGSNALGFFLPGHARERSPASRIIRRPCPGTPVRPSWSSPKPTSPASARRQRPRPLSLASYLQKILTAKVYDVAVETALERAPGLSRRVGSEVLLKREDTQPVFSFKLRGAYNKMAHLTAAQRDRGWYAPPPGIMPKAWPWPRTGWAARRRS
jgi:hypothetical protein